MPSCEPMRSSEALQGSHYTENEEDVKMWFGMSSDPSKSPVADLTTLDCCVLWER